MEPLPTFLNLQDLQMAEIVEDNAKKHHGHFFDSSRPARRMRGSEPQVSSRPKDGSRHQRMRRRRSRSTPLPNDRWVSFSSSSSSSATLTTFPPLAHRRMSSFPTPTVRQSESRWLSSPVRLDDGGFIDCPQLSCSLPKRPIRHQTQDFPGMKNINITEIDVPSSTLNNSTSSASACIGSKSRRRRAADLIAKAFLTLEELDKDDCHDCYHDEMTSHEGTSIEPAAATTTTRA